RAAPPRPPRPIRTPRSSARSLLLLLRLWRRGLLLLVLVRLDRRRYLLRPEGLQRAEREVERAQVLAADPVARTLERERGADGAGDQERGPEIRIAAVRVDEVGPGRRVQLRRSDLELHLLEQ